MCNQVPDTLELCGNDTEVVDDRGVDVDELLLSLGFEIAARGLIVDEMSRVEDAESVSDFMVGVCGGEDRGDFGGERG